MIEPYPDRMGTVSSGDTTTESRRGKLPIGSVSPPRLASMLEATGGSPEDSLTLAGRPRGESERRDASGDAAHAVTVSPRHHRRS